MRLHRFFIDEAIGSKKEVLVASPELANQISRVFRLKRGDRVILFDGSGSDYESEVTEASKGSVLFRVLSATHSRYMPERKIYLCAAVVKKDNFELIVEKATELGVTDIVPVLAEHSEKKSLNEGRLKKIAIEASEQSGRGDVPRICAIKSLEEALSSLVEVDSIVFHTEGNSFERQNVTRSDDIAIFIGPEGGWSRNELDLFHKNKIPVVCLGPQVLRAETAVVAALSQVVFAA